MRVFQGEGRAWRLWAGAFVALWLAACGGGGGASDASWLKAAPASATDAAITGTYWDPFAPGTGFFFEGQGNTGVATFYVFEPGGRAVWYSALGSLEVSTTGHVFRGQLQRFEGGQSSTSTVPRTPQAGAAGDVTIQFASGGSARVQLPGRAFDALKFVLEAARLPSVPVASRPTVLPETGIYWNPAESGRGYTIEVINGYANIGVFHYDGSGQPVWHLVSAALAGNGATTGDFASYRNGQTLSGGYAAPVRTVETGFFQLKTVGPCTVQIGFPGLPPITAHRFSFNPAVEACRGGWTAPVETPPADASLESAGISLKPYALPVSMPVLHELAPVAPTIAGNPKGRTRFRFLSGKWPRGLRLDPDTGVISGVPLDVANFVDGFIAMTVDGYSGESVIPYSVHMKPVFLKLYVNSIGNDHIMSRVVGTPLPAGFGYFVDNGAGGRGKLAPGVIATFSAEGSLPAGLTLSPSGALQGTPTTAGEGSFKAHVDIVYLQDFAVRQTLNMAYFIK